MSNWVEYAQGKPEASGMYLVVTEVGRHGKRARAIMLAQYYKNTDEWVDVGALVVTHWMEVPAMPMYGGVGE